MSCGEPHETDCSEVLEHLYEFLDSEMPEVDRTKFEHHFEECSPCLEKYGLEQAVKKLVKRCCGHDEVPADLRAKVMGRIELIRSGQLVPEGDVTAAPTASTKTASAKPTTQTASAPTTKPAKPGTTPPAPQES